MKNTLILTILLLCCLSNAFSQKTIPGQVKGLVEDTSYKEILADATISVLGYPDSTLITYTRANEKGEFQLKLDQAGRFILIISYQGYEPFKKTFSLSAASPSLNLGAIHLQKASDMMEEIIVERPPITIKGDTVEFAASAFKTKPNALAEDLLKKLPGVEVDKDGNVTAQGEAIPKIYVDGKEFFGSDPKMATKNITADMIESVQVFDDMSEQAKFTRIDDGSRSKTINIKLKKNMKKGHFGRATAGVGTDGRYLASLTMNQFKDERKISFVGSSNNLNQRGFNPRDVIGNMGGLAGGRGGGGNEGINKATVLGLNFTDLIGSKIDLTGSYSFTETDNRTNQTSFRQTSFTQDSIANQNAVNISRGIDRNHNFNLRFEYAIDSMNSILYTPTFTMQQSDDYSRDTSFTNVENKGLSYLALSRLNRSNNVREGLTLNNELLYRRRFNRPGRTFTLGYKNGINKSDGSGTNFSPITYYNPDGTIRNTDDFDIITTQATRSNNNVISSSYTEPLGLNKILEFNYAYTNNQSNSDRKGNSYNPDSKLYDSVNARQTNYFENSFLAHRAGFNFRFRNKQTGFQVGGAMQASTLDNTSIRPISIFAGKDSTINTRQSYINFFPTANFDYDFSRRKNLSVRYRGRTNQPSVRQLQDVRDETNNLRTVIGNPALKQEFNNRVEFIYKSFNETTFRYLNINAVYNQTSNKIVNSIEIDTARYDKDGNKVLGVQLIKPVNLNGSFNSSYDATLGIPLRKGVKGSSLKFSNAVRYSKDVSRLRGQDNFSGNFSVSQSAGVNLDIKEKLNVEFRGRVSFNSVKYSSNQSNTLNLNTDYFSHSYSTDISYFILPNLVLSTDFDYAINGGRAAGFNQNVPLWNGGIAYQLFKKRNGEIKLTVNDILNQNSNIDRRIGENYIVDTRTVIIQRYFLLTFMYNLNKFGGPRGRGDGGSDMRNREGPGRGWNPGGGRGRY